MNIHFPLDFVQPENTPVYFLVHFTPTDLSKRYKLGTDIFIGRHRGGKKVEGNQHANTLGRMVRGRKIKHQQNHPCKVWNNNISSREFLPQNCLLDIKAKVPTSSHRLRCNHVSPHCTFITRCCSANAKFLLSNLLRVQHQGQLLGRTLAKNISTFCGDLWRPHRLPYKLESPDNTGLCEMNYISPSVTTSWLKAGKCAVLCPK